MAEFMWAIELGAHLMTLSVCKKLLFEKRKVEIVPQNSYQPNLST